MTAEAVEEGTSAAETTAVSGELPGQADMLKGLVSKFQLKNYRFGICFVKQFEILTRMLDLFVKTV